MLAEGEQGLARVLPARQQAPPLPSGVGVVDLLSCPPPSALAASQAGEDDPGFEQTCPKAKAGPPY